MSETWQWMAVVFAAAFVSTLPLLWLASLPVRRLPAGSHWSEVARTFWIFRVTASASKIWITIAACVAMERMLQIRGARWQMVVFALAALMGCNAACRIATSGLRIPPSILRGSYKSRITWMLLAPGLPLVLALGAFTWGREINSFTLSVIAALFLTGVVLVMGGSVGILRAIGLLRPADAELERLTRELAASHGVRVRHVMVAEMVRANAFAFPWTRDIGFTRPALTLLAPGELIGILRHELGHLAERPAIKWIRLTGMFALLCIGLTPLVITAAGPIAALWSLAACFVVIRWTNSSYRKMELAADEHAHHPDDAEGLYARALEKLHEHGLIPAVLSKRHAYPSLYDRMTAAGVTPDFPRPAAPNRAKGIILGALATFLFLLLLSELMNLTAQL